MSDLINGSIDSLKLSYQCKAAVSTDLSVLNSACQLKCQEMERNPTEADLFNKSCRIDRRLYAFGIADKSEQNLKAQSSCFSYVTPSSDHVMTKFEASYPGECQERCQETEGCSWFAVARSAKRFRCALINEEGLTNDLILTSRTDGTKGEKYCKSRYRGKLVDCAFGSPVCLMDPHQFYGEADEVFLESKISDLVVLTGPAHCAKSSPDATVEICASMYQTYRSYMDNNYVSPGVMEASGAKGWSWYGIDRLWGAGSVFDKDQWRALYPTYVDKWEDIGSVNDIGNVLEPFESVVTNGFTS